jgi:hypothetical protein
LDNLTASVPKGERTLDPLRDESGLGEMQAEIFEGRIGKAEPMGKNCSMPGETLSWVLSCANKSVTRAWIESMVLSGIQFASNIGWLVIMEVRVSYHDLNFWGIVFARLNVNGI